MVDSVTPTTNKLLLKHTPHLFHLLLIGFLLILGRGRGRGWNDERGGRVALERVNVGGEAANLESSPQLL